MNKKNHQTNESRTADQSRYDEELTFDTVHTIGNLYLFVELIDKMQKIMKTNNVRLQFALFSSKTAFFFILQYIYQFKVSTYNFSLLIKIKILQVDKFVSKVIWVSSIGDCTFQDSLKCVLFLNVQKKNSQLCPLDSRATVKHFCFCFFK